MTAYATLQDVYSLGLRSEAMGSITPTQQQAILDSENAQADSYLRGRYQLPLLEWDTDLRLAISQRTKPSCPVDPALITTVYTLFTCRVKLRVFYMEHPDPLMIIIDVLQVIEALQYKMRRIIQQTCSCMIIYMFQKRFVGYPVMQIFAGMYFITKIYTVFIKLV